jgi:hypothetical protein
MPLLRIYRERTKKSGTWQLEMYHVEHFVVKAMRSELLSALLLEDDDLSFSTRLTRNVHVSGMQGVDVHPEIYVQWRVDIERDGREAVTLMPVVVSVYGHVAFTDYGESAELRRVEISWPVPPQPTGTPPAPGAGVKDWVDFSAPYQTTWEVETEVGPMTRLHLEVKEVEIDLDGVITIRF